MFRYMFSCKQHCDNLTKHIRQKQRATFLPLKQQENLLDQWGEWSNRNFKPYKNKQISVDIKQVSF